MKRSTQILFSVLVLLAIMVCVDIKPLTCNNVDHTSALSFHAHDATFNFHWENLEISHEDNSPKPESAALQVVNYHSGAIQPDPVSPLLNFSDTFWHPPKFI